MAKTIKFNLICDGKPVRTIEDLQNNFSIEDVLVYYNNKLLHRWLEVRGYEEELEKVKSISTVDAIEIVKELIRIFDISNNDKEIEEKIYILIYMEKRKQLYSVYETQKNNIRSITDDYINGYLKLVAGILENPKDVAVIKANIAEMLSNYSWLVELDHRNLFYRLCDKSPLAIMCLLMNEQLRKYYLPVSEKSEAVVTMDGFSKSRAWMFFGDKYVLKKDDKGIEGDRNIMEMFNIISKMIGTFSFKEDLGDNLKVFAGMTEGYWKDLEPKGKKYMIISMEAGDFVRSAGVSGEELGSKDIIYKFVIVDGIDYKSNSSEHKLLYMEV